MVLPLSILNRYDTTRYSSPSGHHRIEGYKQKPPYTLVTWCRMTRTSGKSNYRWFDARNWSYGLGSLPDDVFPSRLEATIENRLAAKFQAKLGDSSSFGATLTAELKETLGMVSSTVLRLASAAKKISRMNFLGAAVDLGLPYKERVVKKVFYGRYGRYVPGQLQKRRKRVQRKVVFTLPNGREVLKTLANGWLFYSYGVKPLAEDIYNGMDVFQRPLPCERIAVSASSGPVSKIIWDRGYEQSVCHTHNAVVRYRASADVSVTNPNLWLMNKMGLINPVQWANEAIPFSFVVDWFSNLSQVIGQLTAYSGLSITNSLLSKRGTFNYRWDVIGPGPDYIYTDSHKEEYLRTPGVLPVPKLVFAYEPFSVARALNAISLLIGFLPRGR